MTSAVSLMRANEQFLPAGKVPEYLDHDLDTGVLCWRIAPGPVKIGSVFGHRRKDGYIRGSIRNRDYYAHRLAWAHVHGEWPTFVIDHENHDPSDNRLVNLRPATFGQSLGNTRVRRTGLKGAYPAHILASGELKWRALISIDRRYTHLGIFDTEEEAHDAYKIAAVKHFGPFACVE